MMIDNPRESYQKRSRILSGERRDCRAYLKFSEQEFLSSRVHRASRISRIMFVKFPER